MCVLFQSIPCQEIDWIKIKYLVEVFTFLPKVIIKTFYTERRQS